MSTRSIWVDLDDVLAHTIEGLVDLLRRDHDRHLAVDDIEHFDLGRSFALGEPALSRFFERAHSADELARLAPRAGAARSLEALRARGFAVHIVTGRPPITADASRAWLLEHAMEHDALHFVDKYGRPAEAVEDVPFEPSTRCSRWASTSRSRTRSRWRCGSRPRPRSRWPWSTGRGTGPSRRCRPAWPNASCVAATGTTSGAPCSGAKPQSSRTGAKPQPSRRDPRTRRSVH